MAEQTQAVEDVTLVATGEDAATGAGQEPASGAEVMSLDEARKLRRESQNLRKRLAEFEKVDGERKAAELSEVERATQQKAALEQELAKLKAEQRAQVVRYEVMLRASALNVVDPDAAVKLLDLDGLAVDDDGAVDGDTVDKALKALLKGKPYLVKQETALAPDVNARTGKQSNGADAAAREEELRRRYRI